MPLHPLVAKYGIPRVALGRSRHYDARAGCEQRLLLTRAAPRLSVKAWVKMLEKTCEEMEAMREVVAELDGLQRRVYSCARKKVLANGT